MACGSNIKTVMLIGNIPQKLFNSVITPENVRVLHLNSSAALMEESEQYKRITGDISNRIFLMALFLQYNFPLIFAENELISDELFIVCKEQWHDEYSNRALISVSDETAQVNLLSEHFSESLVPLHSITEQLEILIK